MKLSTQQICDILKRLNSDTLAELHKELLDALFRSNTGMQRVLDESPLLRDKLVKISEEAFFQLDFQIQLSAYSNEDDIESRVHIEVGQQLKKTTRFQFFSEVDLQLMARVFRELGEAYGELQTSTLDIDWHKLRDSATERSFDRYTWKIPVALINECHVFAESFPKLTKSLHAITSEFYHHCSADQRTLMPETLQQISMYFTKRHETYTNREPSATTTYLLSRLAEGHEELKKLQDLQILTNFNNTLNQKLLCLGLPPIDQDTSTSLTASSTKQHRL